MGIIVRNKEVTLIAYGSRMVSAVYRGARLVWQAVRSCFGSGSWKGNKPWIGTEGWRF